MTEVTAPSFSYKFEWLFVILPNCWVLRPHFFLPCVILPICVRDDTELEMLLYTAGIVRPFAYNFSSGVLRHLELAK